MFQKFPREKKSSRAAKCFSWVLPLPLLWTHLSIYKDVHWVGWEQGDCESALRKQKCRLPINRLSQNQAFMRSQERRMSLLHVVQKIVYNVYYWSHHCHMQLFSQMKTHWSSISVFVSIGVFSDLSDVSYSQEIRSDFKLIVLYLKTKKVSFACDGTHLSFIAVFQVHN